nr:NUDIX hydrolase [Cochlodiniinecator piscidefendens]
MQQALQTAWAEVVQPLLQRPKLLQVAALCTRGTGGNKKVLLVTSRGSQRWILPKGWLMDGKTAAEAAVQEAWEEAGVITSTVPTTSIGHYSYKKMLDSGVVAACEAEVFPLEVHEIAKAFPEKGQRKRKWLSPKNAAKLVSEPKLKEILRQL